MTSQLFAVCFAAGQPERLARFWSGLLGWEQAEDGTLLPDEDAGFRIRFVATGEPKSSQNRAHFDLTSSSLAEQERTVARALELGGRHCDVGQLPEEEHVVLADPEGNEFCVIEPGNKFLAGCGFVGALAGEGLPEAGYFWSAALGWPLVWDQDEETAIQAPRGGPKFTWGGPPLMPKIGTDRVRLELTATAGEVDRLISLGATPIGAEPGHVRLADPSGVDFSVRLDPGHG
ncbi:VOC family protein [Actinoplanes sp. GCM10030250]|uniref:VOC family protein n=1 Tax=Actinoplanes sp. GCM10030250 TaxID=3273376 RepID=UPI00360E7C8F